MSSVNLKIDNIICQYCNSELHPISSADIHNTYQCDCTYTKYSKYFRSEKHSLMFSLNFRNNKEFYRIYALFKLVNEEYLHEVTQLFMKDGRMILLPFNPINMKVDKIFKKIIANTLL